MALSPHPPFATHPHAPLRVCFTIATQGDYPRLVSSGRNSGERERWERESCSKDKFVDEHVGQENRP
ncbi:MAG TPA: hypothetical protein VH592_18875 [Gemmataceae bacterium]